jgi:hypothetical protein
LKKSVLEKNATTQTNSSTRAVIGCFRISRRVDMAVIPGSAYLKCKKDVV